MNGSGFQRLSLNANYLKTLCISKLKCCTHHISRILDTRFAVPIILRSVALAVFAVSTSYNLGETFRRTFSLGSTYVSMYGWAVHFITFDTVEKLRVFDFTVSEEPSWKASSQASTNTTWTFCSHPEPELKSCSITFKALTMWPGNQILKVHL